MTEYIVRRLIQAVFVLILITLIVFLAMRLLPGDPIYMIITRENVEDATEEYIAAVRHEFGLDKPLIVQYFDWLSGVIRGDLGISIINRSTVSSLIATRVPITLHLGLLAFILSIIIGIPVGIVSAIRRGRWIDSVLTVLANIGITIPIFWLGILMIYAFGLSLRWLPIFGYTSPLEDFWMSTQQVIMPVICMSVGAMAGNARLTRSTMLEVMQQDYIRTAWSKGLREQVIIMRHGLKNAFIPIVTMVGVILPTIIGGSVLIETVFNIPGMGRLAVDGVNAYDYPVVQGVTLIIAVVVTLVNLAVDISYGWLDPRIRYR